MTLKTINYIHKLLIDQEAKTKRAYEMLCESYEKADLDDAANAPYLREARDSCRKVWFESLDALQDFESKIWS